MDFNIVNIIGDNQKYFKDGKVIKNDKISNNSNEHKFSDILKKSMNNVKDKDSVDISDEGAVRDMYMASTGQMSLFDYKKSWDVIKKSLPSDVTWTGSPFINKYLREDGKLYIGKKVENPIEYEQFKQIVNKGEIVNPDWAIPEEKLPPLDEITSQPRYSIFRKALTLGLFDENGNIMSKETYEKLKV